MTTYIGSYELDEFNVTVEPREAGGWHWTVDSRLADYYTHDTGGIVATREEALQAGLAEVVRRCEAERDRALALLEKYKGAK
jgi:hypothetical protein